MKKLVCTLLPTLAIALVLGITSRTAYAQDYPFALSYFSNAHASGAPDGVLRIVNDGNTGGWLYSNIYVFDNREELLECCSCGVSPNGLLTLSVNKNLTSNPLTGRIPTRGVIKTVSSTTSNPTRVTFRAGQREWLTHIQKASTATTYAITESQMTDSTLGGIEFSTLQADCSFAIVLGSGQGVCSCTDSGQ
jgi:hypothetical protein